MPNGTICPYFHNESGCDVGEDYISPHDVETIVGFCNGRYRDCMTFRMIEEYGMKTVQNAQPFPQEIDTPMDMTLSPLSRGIFALLGLAMGLCLLGSSSLSASAAAILLMAGGLVLIVHGIHDWRREMAFAATVNCAYGLFSVSLIPLLALPQAGISASPDPWGTTAFLAMWGLFSIAIYISAFESDRWLGSVFGLLTAAILTLAVATAISGSTLGHIAGGFFLASGLLSLLALALQRNGDHALQAANRSTSL